MYPATYGSLTGLYPSLALDELGDIYGLGYLEAHNITHGWIPAEFHCVDLHGYSIDPNH